MRKNNAGCATARVPMAMLLGLGMLTSTQARAQEDLIAAGKTAFKRCSACHAIGEGAKNKVGPELNALIGRPAGGLEGFNYSAAMKEAGAGGLVWTAETLHTYLENPKGMIPGTKMTFAGLKKVEDRHAVIAYMEQAGAGGS